MKKTMMLAAALVLVGCGEKKADMPAADTAAMAPAATCRHRHGHGRDVARQHVDADSTMARDTTKK